MRRRAAFILDAGFEDDDFLIQFDGIKKVESRSGAGSFQYEPVLFHEGRQVHEPQRLMLEVLGALLAPVQGKAPDRGVICRGPDCSATTVQALIRIQRDETAPKLLLNKHCQVGEFRARCHTSAVAEENLTLLRGVGAKEVRAYERKGRFTLTQLAHTFRPRRKGRRSDQPSRRRASCAAGTGAPR